MTIVLSRFGVLELKNWTGFWGESIKKQFTKDLIVYSEPGTLKWVFNKKGVNQSLEELQENVLTNLRKADGSTPIDELNEVVSKAGETLGVIFEREIMNSEQLLDALSDKEIFESIFVIVGE